jgi:transposase
MLMLPSSTRIFVYAHPIDMRRSFDALGQCVRDVLKQDPESGALFIFAGKRGTSLKILWWDKPGCSILYKRLTHGTFRLPAAVGGELSVPIDARELALILQGVEPPTRKQRVKALVKQAREKALRISKSAATDPPA